MKVLFVAHLHLVTESVTPFVAVSPASFLTSKMSKPAKLLKTHLTTIWETKQVTIHIHQGKKDGTVTMYWLT